MSRSYRKQPISKDHTKGMKTIANRKVRRALNRNPEFSLPNGSYRKYFDSYDICNYRDLVPKSFNQYFEDEVLRWVRWLQNFGVKNLSKPNKKEEYRKWAVHFRGK